MEVYLGMVTIFGFGFNPRGWMTCQGQQLSIAQNTALFSLLGTTYGGNGQTTFGLPDLRGRVPIGQGQGPGLSPFNIGDVGGVENMTLSAQNLPVHTHTAAATSTSTSDSTSVSTMFAESAQADAQNPNGKMLASGTNIYTTPVEANNRTMGPQSVSTATTTTTTTNTAVTIGAAGGSQPFALRTPFLAVNYCIATEGLFPSRN